MSRESARDGRALRKGRDVARVCACDALAAGARSGIARGVPSHGYATRRHCRPDRKIEREGRGSLRAQPHRYPPPVSLRIRGRVVGRRPRTPRFCESVSVSEIVTYSRLFRRTRLEKRCALAPSPSIRKSGSFRKDTKSS
ncbi:unnamed protein product [Euphydryas editha]|uniref:Uncharacterized protein n=1 Tax=Euphydryas editha TaxID=104508 RepID=A0AAU9TM16_EUPED|nr:unnamed protein product [Euphydryas editha]